MFNLILAFTMAAVGIMFLAVLIMESVFLAGDLRHRFKNVPESVRSFHRTWLVRTYMVRMGGSGIILFLVESAVWTYLCKTL